jgi:hypothetical protein
MEFVHVYDLKQIIHVTQFTLGGNGHTVPYLEEPWVG